MKSVFMICCYSFTAVILFISLFSQFDMAPLLSDKVALQAFTFSLSIAIIMAFADKINKNADFSIWTDLLIRIVICFAVVLIEGIWFKMLPFSWKAVIYAAPIVIPVFIITYFFSYITCMDWADKINKSIQKKK
ncbi:MAG: DUF3021 domain-containing protein [Clostridiales bacterium]|nr:DUF3021 domain-containing protein [Clostridiales bacterium]